MAIDSYALNQDASLAESRYNQLGENASTYLSDIEFNPADQLISDIDSFRDVVEMTSPLIYWKISSRVEENLREIISLKWALLVTVVLAGALVARYFLAKRAKGGGIAPKAAVKHGAGDHCKNGLPGIQR